MNRIERFFHHHWKEGHDVRPSIGFLGPMQVVLGVDSGLTGLRGCHILALFR